MKNYDVILIGTGQATGTMLSVFLEMGKSVATVEKERVGGTCVNWGCTPTKTLVAGARVAHMVGRAGDFGIEVSEFRINFAKVMERQKKNRESSSTGFEQWLREATDFYKGEAKFTGAHEVQVGDETIWGETIYIHTGATARIPPIPGIESVDYLDNKGILSLDELPEHLIVVGGSYVGLEFSQIFRRFGSKVTVLERGPRIMSREDEDVAAEASRILTGEGIEILHNVQVESVSPEGGVTVSATVGGKKRAITGSHILLATGRVPLTEALNLPAAGVEVNEPGFIRVNEYLQTTTPHIYAVGDVNGGGAFTHTSVHDGQIIVKNLKGENWRQSDRIPVYSMFIDPPMGRVGMSEIQAKQSGREILKGTMAMSSINRAREKDETGGLVKVLVDAKTGQLLGATVFGTGGDEVINMFASWMYTHLPYTEFQKAVLVHPTVSELMPYVFENLEPIG
ncbi:MAG: mercuric reductase [Gammaproteobacteria bacterium]|nr:mercuric reductase [Gammaproteobacteria bacterium]